MANRMTGFLCGVLLFPIGVFGQAFNIDIGTSLLTAEVPSDSYGAAAGQTGRWTLGEPLGEPLVDTSGRVTSARTRFGPVGATSLSGIVSSNVDERLMMGTALILDSNLADSATVTGLQPGWYDVYVYCWSGQSTPRYIFSQPVIAIDFASDIAVFQPASNRPWPGGQVEGVTYVKARGYIDSATQIRYSVPTNRSAALSGIQIVPVPSPGAGLVLAAGLSLCSIRRRR